MLTKVPTKGPNGSGMKTYGYQATGRFGFQSREKVTSKARAAGQSDKAVANHRCQPAAFRHAPADHRRRRGSRPGSEQFSRASPTPNARYRHYIAELRKRRRGVSPAAPFPFRQASFAAARSPATNCSAECSQLSECTWAAAASASKSESSGEGRPEQTGNLAAASAAEGEK